MLATCIDSALIALLCTIVFYFLAGDIIYSTSAKEFSVSFAATQFLEINSDSALFCWFLLCFFDALFLILQPLGLLILSSVATYSYPVEILRQCLLAGILISFSYRFLFEFSALRATPGKMLTKLRVESSVPTASRLAYAKCLLTRNMLKIVSMPIALGLFLTDARNGRQGSSLDNRLPHDKLSRTILRLEETLQ